MAEKNFKHPVLDITQFNPETVRAFAIGCERIKREINNYQPDILCFPERGASPLDWSMEKNPDDKPAVSISLPIGTHYILDSKQLTGMGKYDKKRIIEQALPIKSEPMPAQRIILIDEAQQGGTIVDHTQLIFESLRPEDHLLVISAKDSIHNPKTSPKYRSLFNNPDRKVPFERIEIRLPMIAMDRPRLLNELVSTHKYETPRIIINTAAETLFHQLNLIYKHGTDCIDEIIEPLPPELQDETADWYINYRDICSSK